MAKGTEPVSAALRQAILGDGRPVLELSARSGVDQGIIGRFLRDDGLPLSAVDALARVLELELRPATSPATLPELAAAIAAAGRRRSPG